MSAGLLASTVTPGRTAPVASFTTPANALCARAVAGSARNPSATTHHIAKRLLIMPTPPQSFPDRDIDGMEATVTRGWIPRGNDKKVSRIRDRSEKLDRWPRLPKTSRSLLIDT